jgi:hypothetical protein
MSKIVGPNVTWLISLLESLWSSPSRRIFLQAINRIQFKLFNDSCDLV